MQSDGRAHTAPVVFVYKIVMRSFRPYFISVALDEFSRIDLRQVGASQYFPKQTCRFQLVGINIVRFVGAKILKKLVPLTARSVVHGVSLFAERYVEHIAESKSDVVIAFNGFCGSYRVGCELKSFIACRLNEKIPEFRSECKTAFDQPVSSVKFSVFGLTVVLGLCGMIMPSKYARIVLFSSALSPTYSICKFLHIVRSSFEYQ